MTTDSEKGLIQIKQELDRQKAAADYDIIPPDLQLQPDAAQEIEEQLRQLETDQSPENQMVVEITKATLNRLDKMIPGNPYKKMQSNSSAKAIRDALTNDLPNIEEVAWQTTVKGGTD